MASPHSIAWPKNDRWICTSPFQTPAASAYGRMRRIFQPASLRPMTLSNGADKVSVTASNASVVLSRRSLEMSFCNPADTRSCGLMGVPLLSGLMRREKFWRLISVIGSIGAKSFTVLARDLTVSMKMEMCSRYGGLTPGTAIRPV